MFDDSLAEIADLEALDDATLVDTVRGWARAEAAAGARKLAVMAELFLRRTDTPTAVDRELWWVDPCGAVCAELGAAQGISQWAALAQTRTAVALRDRLPNVAALLADGLIDTALAGAIVWRTLLIQDPEPMARVDTDLAARISGWGARSATKIIRDIDALVLAHDPGALRKSAAAARSRFLDIGGLGDEPGTMGLSGRLSAHDGLRVDARLAEMADSVCPHDARSRDERRIDAMAARVLGDQWGCRCGRADCPATPA
ncbi:13E12 repeat family protein, partial [Mycobacterium sp. 21AC1]|uniref:DUF222 domain-containing protein n=1 Tax=[Mycobacterium] appelbergii TaxID=2939269 RepID=UPI002938FBCE